MDIGGVGLGGVCGRIGTARPTSVCPRAFSTLGLLKRLNNDILEATRSTFLGGAGNGACFFAIDGVCDATDDDRSGSCRVAVDRLKRHRDDIDEL